MNSNEPKQITNTMKQNKAAGAMQMTLFDTMFVEIKKVRHRLSFSPKTVIMIPYNATKEEIETIEAKYRGEDGKIKHDAISDYEIFGGQKC